MITVSIVLHNTRPELVRSVLASLKKENVEKVYLMDNSPDTSLSRFADASAKVEYRHIENRGYGNAHNAAIVEAAAEGSRFHLVLNPDVRWDGEILRRLADVMESRPEVGLLQPKIVYPDGRLQHTCRLLPTPFDVFAKRFLPSFLIKGRMHHYMLPPEAYERDFNAVYMQGSFLLFRTDALMQTGLFDERFFMYPEDIDITRRIRSGYDALYYPDVCVVHDHAAGSSRFGRLLWIHIKNMVKYFNKWGWFVDGDRRRLNRRLLRELRAARQDDSIDKA